MTRIKKLALALCLVLSYSNYSNSQELVPGQAYSTGNLTNFTNQATDVTSTWQNAGTIGSPLTCWRPGDQGYCGPLPMVAAGGSGTNIINFSYGHTDLHQYVNIGKALANAGNGVQVTGFNFSFTAKNGNGWDNGQTDYLSAYVKFYDNTNRSVLESYNYNLNYNFNWTSFNYNETFASPYDINKLGNARYGFIGGDSNYWAGPYGPEVNNTSFSLKYGTDPCASDPLFSPTCARYTEALKKLVPAQSTETVTITPTATGVTVTATDLVIVPATNSTPISAPASNTTISAPVVASAAPSANNPQPKAGEITVSGSKPTVSVSSIMNMISSEQSRIGAVEKSVVSMAVSEAAKAGEQAAQQAEAVAGTLTSQSIAGSLATSSGSSLMGFSSRAVASQSVAMNMGLTSTANTSVGLRTPMQASSFDVSSVSMSQSTDLSNNFNLSMNRLPANAVLEVVQAEGIKFGVRSTLGDYLNEKPFMTLQGLEPTQDGMVKRNVQPNEVADGVDIASMATQPKGYDAYAQMTLSDAAFYKVDAIYKDQRTVDNQRNLRGLQGGSDRLHQEMVNQQYKLGN